MQDHLNLRDEIIEEFADLHIEVLKKILFGRTFEEIEYDLDDTLHEFNYNDLTSFFSLLHFDDNGRVVRAYPISPIPTIIRMTVEGIGKGYAMCAIDSLGVAYLFGAKTEIESVDPSSRVPIRITIDPNQVKPKIMSNVIVTMPKTVEEAAFCCPHVKFLSCEGREVHPEGVISFEDAMKYGMTFFSRSNLKQKFKSRLLPLVQLYNIGSLTADELSKSYSEGPRFNLLSSLFPNDFGRIMLVMLCEKGVIKKHETSEDVRIVLTSKGERILNTFR